MEDWAENLAGPSVNKAQESGISMKFILFALFFFVNESLAGGEPNHSELKPIRGTLTEELSQRAIHELYNNGEFETVIEVLERFQKNNPRYSFSDSVFLAKHLAVVYTATPATREKGRFYMMRLLELVPTAKLIDMFVSDEIDRIFERVREEFIAKQRGFGLDSLTIKIPNQRSKDSVYSVQSGIQNRSSKWGNSMYWIIGGIATLAVGASAHFYWSMEEPDSNPRELIVARPDGEK